MKCSVNFVKETNLDQRNKFGSDVSVWSTKEGGVDCKRNRIRNNTTVTVIAVSASPTPEFGFPCYNRRKPKWIKLGEPEWRKKHATFPSYSNSVLGPPTSRFKWSTKSDLIRANVAVIKVETFCHTDGQPVRKLKLKSACSHSYCSIIKGEFQGELTLSLYSSEA